MDVKKELSNLELDEDAKRQMREQTAKGVRSLLEKRIKSTGSHTGGYWVTPGELYPRFRFRGYNERAELTTELDNEDWLPVIAEANRLGLPIHTRLAMKAIPANLKRQIDDMILESGRTANGYLIDKLGEGESILIVLNREDQSGVEAFHMSGNGADRVHNTVVERVDFF